LLILIAGPAAGLGTDGDCGRCHKAQAVGNTMTRTLYPIRDAVILKVNPRLTYQLGRFSYRIDRHGDQSHYSVSDGTSTMTFLIEYAFGQGAAGQTYAFRHQGRWYESRLSFYKETGALDLTMGAPPAEPKGLLEAAGREMTSKDVVECFGCHTTNSLKSGQIDFANLQAGIGCENCHGPATRHARAVLSGNLREAAMPKLSAMTTEEQSEACGRCHRTWADIAANGPRGVGNVRFQPYRIANSRCYDATDRRISCTACHDPHGPLETRSAAYDPMCSACHAAGPAGAVRGAARAKARACPTGKSDCASCHMPRYEIPGSHHLFTDHQIRIVRKNDQYPN
jgi:hypothetical protein